ncbi:MAG: hypothetical protein ACKOAK_02155, partial [Ignavibacteria bacterium]
LEAQQAREFIQEQESWILADVEHKANETLHWELFPDPNKPQDSITEQHDEPIQTTPEPPMAMNIIELEQRLRQECSALSQRMMQSLRSQGLKADIRTIHTASKKRFGKSQDDMNLHDLEAKKEWLFQCLERGRLF